MIASLFAEVEAALADAVESGDLECVGDAVHFSYDTRLVLPAMLALGRVHEIADDVPVRRRKRRVDHQLVSRGHRTTENIVRALIDGDMRDAVNDDEFEDFETNVRPRSRAAKIAQITLQRGVDEWLEDPETPGAVEESYRRAVDLSEGHQERDREFRSLLKRFHEATGEERMAIADEIRERYVFADGPVSEPFEAERELPYFVTQYERVGVLYEEMLAMYEADLGRDLGSGFARSIVLMVIAAQVGLDDTDDYPDDRRSQLTPVTAELSRHGVDEGVTNLYRIVDTYLDRARTASDDHLTGMAIEYIRHQSHDRLGTLSRSVTSSRVSESRSSR